MLYGEKSALRSVTRWKRNSKRTYKPTLSERLSKRHGSDRISLKRN